MRAVSLYLGQQWHEDLAGRVSENGVLEIGRGPSTTYPAHADGDRLVYGAPWVYGPAQSTLGLFDERKREVIYGSNRYEGPIGSWDEQGIVYLGPVERMERVGRCDPPSAVGAACLLLILAPGAPHAEALKAAATAGETMKGLEVLHDPMEHTREVARVAAVAGGALVGAAISHEVAQVRERSRQAQAEGPSKHVIPSQGLPRPPAPTRRRSMRPVLAIVVAILMGAAVCSGPGGGSSSAPAQAPASAPKAIATGARVQQLLSEELRSKAGTISSISCPDSELKNGQSVSCVVTLSTGRQQRLSVHVAGSGRKLHLRVGAS